MNLDIPVLIPRQCISISTMQFTTVTYLAGEIYAPSLNGSDLPPPPVGFCLFDCPLLFPPLDLSLFPGIPFFSTHPLSSFSLRRSSTLPSLRLSSFLAYSLSLTSCIPCLPTHRTQSPPSPPKPPQIPPIILLRRSFNIISVESSKFLQHPLSGGGCNIRKPCATAEWKQPGINRTKRSLLHPLRPARVYRISCE